jgi:hypothetical protein
VRGAELELHAGNDELTVLQREGAFLHAQGMGSVEIARALEVHEKTPSKWLKQPAYAAEVARWQNFSMERMLVGLRSRAALAAEKALVVLVEALAAEDAEGRPLYPVRIAAAKEVFSNPILRSMFAERVAGPDVQVDSSTVVTVVFNERNGEQVVEYKEGEVEDGHWTVGGDDRSSAGATAGDAAGGDAGAGDGDRA